MTLWFATVTKLLLPFIAVKNRYLLVSWVFAPGYRGRSARASWGQNNKSGCPARLKFSFGVSGPFSIGQLVAAGIESSPVTLLQLLSPTRKSQPMLSSFHVHILSLYPCKKSLLLLHSRRRKVRVGG